MWSDISTDRVATRTLEGTTPLLHLLGTQRNGLRIE
jgi:hypothetical protein